MHYRTYIVDGDMNDTFCWCVSNLSDKGKREELIRTLSESIKLKTHTQVIVIFSDLVQIQYVALKALPSAIHPGLNFFCVCKLSPSETIEIRINTDLNLKLERIPSNSKYKEVFRLKYFKHSEACEAKSTIPNLSKLAYQTSYANGLTEKKLQYLIKEGILPKEIANYKYKWYSHLTTMSIEQAFGMKIWFNNTTTYTCNNPKTHLGATFLNI